MDVIGTQQRINFPDLLDQLAPRTRRDAPCLRRTMLDDFNRRARSRTTLLLCCCRRVVRGCLLCLPWTLPALTAHLVGVPAVVTHHLKALIRNVLRDCRDEIACAEHLKVALDLQIHSRAIENRIARKIHLHLRYRKWIANNVSFFPYSLICYKAVVIRFLFLIKSFIFSNINKSDGVPLVVFPNKLTSWLLFVKTRIFILNLFLLDAFKSSS